MLVLIGQPEICIDSQFTTLVPEFIIIPWAVLATTQKD